MVPWGEGRGGRERGGCKADVCAGSPREAFLQRRGGGWGRGRSGGGESCWPFPLRRAYIYPVRFCCRRLGTNSFHELFYKTCTRYVVHAIDVTYAACEYLGFDETLDPTADAFFRIFFSSTSCPQIMLPCTWRRVRSFWVRQYLFCPYYDVFSVGSGY